MRKQYVEYDDSNGKTATGIFHDWTTARDPQALIEQEDGTMTLVMWWHVKFLYDPE